MPHRSINSKKMNQKKNKKQSLINIISILAIVILINYSASFLIIRLDLTSEGRYTLSGHTVKLLNEIDDQIYVKVYLDGNDLPVGFKRMRSALNDLLEEFSYIGNKEISFRFINPSENPDKNVRFGIYKDLYQKGLIPIESTETTDEGKTISKMVFPGVVVVYKGKDLGVNLLKNDPRYRNDSEENINNSIQSMEYELTNAFRKLIAPKKQKIAFIEGHGELDEYQVVDITTVLSEYYEVQRGTMNGMPGILDEFSAIIIAHPIKRFNENDKLVLDQYLMKGGKILWLLDGSNADIDSLRKIPVTVAMPLDLNLDDQLFRYGIRLNPGLLQDAQCAAIGMARQGGDGRPNIELFPWPYFPIILSNNSHEINKYLNLIRLEFASTIDTVASSPKVKKEILLYSSKKSRFDYSPAQVSLENVQKQVDESSFRGGKLPVAVLLEGVFESNFKNRLIKDLVLDKENIITYSKPTKMIVASDGDLPVNKVNSKGQVYPVGFDINSQQTYLGNKDFILNSVNYLCDDDGLMSIRLREIKMRLLNKAKVSKEKTFWKSMNTILPVLIIIAFGILANYLRKRKYSRNW